MAVSGYRVLMTWQDAGVSVNEEYIWNDETADPFTVVYVAANNLMKSRSLLMGFGVRPVRFRITKIGARRWYLNSKPADVTSMAVGSLIVATNPSADVLAAGVSKNQDGSADRGQHAILMDLYNTPQIHGRKFLGGVPDVMIRENPSGPWLVGVASWGTQFDQYRALLISPDTRWSFRARTVSEALPYKPQPVTRIVLETTTSIISVQTTTMAAPVGVGSFVQLRGFKMFDSLYKNLNGQYQIDLINAGSVGGTSLYALRNTQGIVFDQIDRLGTIELIDYTAYRITECYPTKDTDRQRGNSNLAPRGRRRTVKRITN